MTSPIFWLYAGLLIASLVISVIALGISVFTARLQQKNSTDSGTWDRKHRELNQEFTNFVDVVTAWMKRRDMRILREAKEEKTVSQIPLQGVESKDELRRRVYADRNQEKK